MRCAYAGDNVLALSIDQIFSIEDILPVGWVASESDSGARGFSQVSEYHQLNINRCSPFGRDAVLLTIEDGTLVLP